MDADLFTIRKMKQGDEEAFDAFVRKNYNDILKYCTFHCADRREAEDLTQETFVRFFAKLSEYRYQGKTKNYLYTIAANLCRNHYKKQRAVPLEEDVLTAVAGAAPDEEAAASTHLLLEWALDQLPAQQREVIILYYYQGLKLREIADVLKIGLPLVKYRLRQAKIALQNCIGKEAFPHDTGRTAQH